MPGSPARDGDGTSIKVMCLRYAGTCMCGRAVAKGERAGYDTITHKVVCPACLERRGVTASSAGRSERAAGAGASLRRAHDHREAMREARIRDRFPRIGGFLLSVIPEPASTAAFKTGAEGEEKAADRIIKASGPEVLFLLNRRLGPGRRDGDIDMLAISAAGVLVVDVKHYRGAKVDVRSTGGLISPRVDKLIVSGRDKSAWLSGLHRQGTAVHAALEGLPCRERPPVSLAVCFVDADLPMFERLRIDNVTIFGSRELGRRLRTAIGPLDAQGRTTTAAWLDSRLPAA